MKRNIFLSISLLCLCTVMGCSNNVALATNQAAVSSNEASQTEEANWDTELEELEEKKLEDIKTESNLPKMASVHDPSIFKGDDGMYYIFGSHMSSAKSEDLRIWESFSEGVRDSNKLFSNLFDEDLTAFSFVGMNSDMWYSVWAPDVMYNEKLGKYVMYFCTSSTYIKSSICMAFSDNIEGPYEFQDILLYSGFEENEVENTNLLDYVDESEVGNYIGLRIGYNNKIWPNCIDPSVFYDKDGKLWMVYGSWSGGIFLLEMDEETGYPIHPEYDKDNQVDPYYGRRLIGGYHQSIEGPYMIYDEDTDYYYLFVSYGWLERKGGYQIRVFRSKDVTGPFVDPMGETMTLVDPVDSQYNARYGLKIMGNYKFPSIEKAYMSPGHCSVLKDSDGKMYVIYHTRFDNGTEKHQPRVHQLFMNEYGWPVAAPFETNSETLKQEGLSYEEVAGVYYIVNHGMDISEEIHDAKKYEFYSNGMIFEKTDEGLKSVGDYILKENSPYVNINIDGNSFDGVFIGMQDEASNDTLCFSAASYSCESIWGVCYK